MENQLKAKARYKVWRGILIFWTLFVGIGAVAGAIGMLVDPSGRALGMDAMLPYFAKLPFADVLFADFVFSGVALLVVNGLTNLVAAVLLFCNKKLGIVLGGVFGVTLMLWICIQFYTFPFNFMSTAYFVFGLLQAITAYAAFVARLQSEYVVDEEAYPNVGTNDKRLVVYFSRMGYVKKQALEVANQTGAELYEIRSTEKTDGSLGFWWCGRYGMHKWDMPIEPITVDLTKYDHVTICTPIWVFSLAAPVRTFARNAAGKIKEVDYVLVHFTNGKYNNVVRELDELLGVTHTEVWSIRCRMGRIKSIKWDNGV